MKVFYLNDERTDVTVKVMDDTWDNTYQDDNAKNFCRLQPAEGRVFEIVCPEGSVLWVKKWPSMVMISYIDPAGLSQLDEHLPRSGAV